MAEDKGKIEMLATIVDPTVLDLKAAQELCDDNPELKKCDVVRENARNHEEDKAIEISYDILVANFE